MMSKPTKDQWKKHFEEQKKSKLSIVDYCREHKLSESGFYRHRMLLQGKKSVERFVPVVVSDKRIRKLKSPVSIQLDQDGTVTLKAKLDDLKNLIQTAKVLT